MYFPTVERVTPEDVGLLDVDEVIPHTNASLELTSWYRRAEEGQPTILFFHGNGGAHVDARLSDEYVALAREGALGNYVHETDGQELHVPIADAHFPSIRQIGFEVPGSPEFMELLESVK